MNARSILTPERLAWLFPPLFLGALLWAAQRTPRPERPPIYGLEPGARAQAHADIADCRSCHVTQRKVTSAKCLSCHSQIASRLRAPSGPHARAQAQGLDCVACHREHRGANFDLAGWSTVTRGGPFDHAAVGFVLRGKHEQVRCQQCHKNSPQRFAPTPTSCAAATCHGQSEPHRGSLGVRCESCHSESVPWQPPLFDHNDPQATSRFRLTGKHLQVACAGCHKPGTPAAAPQFLPTQTACRSCHRSIDPHHGRKPLCGNCHQTTGWK